MFYNTNRNAMKSRTDDYVYGVLNEEVKSIIENIKNDKYARLRINLRYPWENTNLKK